MPNRPHKVVYVQEMQKRVPGSGVLNLNPYYRRTPNQVAMNEKDANEDVSNALTDEDKDHIAAAFAEEIEPKLRHLHGRRGVLNCDFAGERYRHWNIRFESAGSGFTIVDFEFDKEGCGLDLDL